MLAAARRTFVLTVALGALMAMALPALAQGPYPAGAGIVCDASVLSPGDTLTCSIDGCVPGTVVEGSATFQTGDDGSTVVADASVADSTGTGTLEFVVPGNASGPVDVTMSCLAPDGSVQVLNAGVVATVAPAGGGDDGAGGGALGNTGGPFQLGSAIGAFLLIAGALLLVMTGRRRTI